MLNKSVSSYTNASTGRTINYYEVEIKPYQQQVYPNLGKANLVGYDGVRILEDLP